MPCDWDDVRDGGCDERAPPCDNDWLPKDAVLGRELVESCEDIRSKELHQNDKK